jgi:predicted acetyltransferase
VTAGAHAALWRYLTTIDLFPRVSYWNLPVDDPLRWKMRSPRRLEQPIKDALWLRVLDVPAALTARRYASDGALTVAVTDAYYEDLAGSYRLEGGPEAAACERTSAGSDLQMSSGALAMLYLGGRSVATLAAAGLIEGDAAAVALADRMFAWHRAPWCAEVF